MRINKFMIVVILVCNVSVMAGGAFFINPGLKVGYNFGKYNGMVLGLELSSGMTLWDNNNSGWNFAGIVTGFSRCFRKDNKNYIYFEFEGGNVVLGGGSIGYLINMDNNRSDLYLRLFAGLFGYLSYRYTLGELPSELSLVGKLPLTTNGPVLD